MYQLKTNKIIEVEVIGNPSDGYENEARQFKRIQVWRFGWIALEQRPELSGYDEKEGLSIYDAFEDFDHYFEEGSHRFVFPDTFTKEMRTQILELDVEGDLCDAGWEVIESETRFFGPLEVMEL